MKSKWMLDIIVAAIAVAALLVWLLCFPPQGAQAPADTVPTDPTPTAPVDPTVPDAVDGLSFTGKVLEVDGDSVLMECYDKTRFDTVWVNVAATGAAPQVGEEYVVVYEDMMMPSLPPRITARTIEKK